MNIVEEVKKKREFSELSDSIVKRVVKITEGDVKESRALLRKYFGVFLTNKIFKGKISADEMLTTHMSSKKRNYLEFYKDIFSGIKNVGSVIDLGCGINGFSYKYLQNILGDIDYVGIEATGQLVKHVNKYFHNERFPAKVIVGDLFDIDTISKVLQEQKKERVMFLFQVIDVLENFERNFSKKFILEISKECEKIILSLPIESLGGRRSFIAQRKWIVDFLDENFEIEKDFEMNGERVLAIDIKK